MSDQSVLTSIPARLNMNCPINRTSYGYVSSYFMSNLLLVGHDIRHAPIGRNDPDPEMVESILPAISRNDYFYDAPCLKIWHQNDLGAFYGKGPRVGFPIFELESFNEVELHSLGNPDHLIVCSQWAKEVIKSTSKRDASVVPLGYDSRKFKPQPFKVDGSTYLGFNASTTVFANFGKFEIRKGHDVLSDIFNKAFNEDDDVALVMMPANPFMTNEEINEFVNRYKRSRLKDKIFFIPRLEAQSQVAQVMNSSHCGVFPSRAEGWNLEALEMLACGRHVIITDATAHKEFCNRSNCLLVDMESGYEPAYDGKWFNGDFDWRKIGDSEIDQFVEYMRSVHKKHKEGSLTLNNAGIVSTLEYTWENSTRKLSKVLNNL